MPFYGLDLSEHNGMLDFNSIKASGNDFVILRAGYGWAPDQKDRCFDAYYKQAKEAGLLVGAYHYSYARNDKEAKEEAACFLNWIKGKQFEMPVYIDMEDADGWKRRNGNPSGSDQASAANTFMEIVEKAGYYVGIYASTSWLNGYLAGLSTDYHQWEANWGSNDEKVYGLFKPIHQYTSVWELGGKRFDRNICYQNFAAEIKASGLNGFEKEETNMKPINPTEWINNHLGKIYDIDGAFGIQCVDLFKIFLKEIGFPNPAQPLGGSGYADEIWYQREKYKDYFTFHTGEIRPGDIVIWAKGAAECPSSHVAMFVKDDPANPSRGIFLGSNQGYEHSNGNLVSISLSGSLGHLRYKGFTSATAGVLIAEHGKATIRNGHNVNLRLGGPTGRIVGQLGAGESLEYNGKIVTNGHRYVVAGNLYLAVTPTESRSDYWADITAV